MLERFFIFFSIGNECRLFHYLEDERGQMAPHPKAINLCHYVDVISRSNRGLVSLRTFYCRTHVHSPRTWQISHLAISQFDLHQRDFDPTPVEAKGRNCSFGVRFWLSEH